MAKTITLTKQNGVYTVPPVGRFVPAPMSHSPSPSIQHRPPAQPPAQMQERRYSDVYKYSQPLQDDKENELRSYYSPINSFAGDYPEYQRHMKKYGSVGAKLYKYGSLPGMIPNYMLESPAYKSLLDKYDFEPAKVKENVLRKIKNSESLTEKILKYRNPKEYKELLDQKLEAGIKNYNPSFRDVIGYNTPLNSYLYGNSGQRKQAVSEYLATKYFKNRSRLQGVEHTLGTNGALDTGIVSAIPKITPVAAAIPGFLRAAPTLSHGLAQASTVRSNLQYQRDAEQYGKWGKTAQIARTLGGLRFAGAMLPNIATAMGKTGTSLGLVKSIAELTGNTTKTALGLGGSALSGVGGALTSLGGAPVIGGGLKLAGSALGFAGHGLTAATGLPINTLALIGGLLPSLFSAFSSIKASATRTRLYGKKIPNRGDIQKYTIADRYDPVISAAAVRGELRPYEQFDLALQRDHSQILANILARMDLKTDSRTRNLDTATEKYGKFRKSGKPMPGSFLDRMLGRSQKALMLTSPVSFLWSLIAEGKTPWAKFGEINEAFGLGKYSRKEKKKQLAKMNLTNSESRLMSYSASDIANLSEDCCSKQVSLLTYLGDMSKEIWLNLRAIRLCGYGIRNPRNLVGCRLGNRGAAPGTFDKGGNPYDEESKKRRSSLFRGFIGSGRFGEFGNVGGKGNENSVLATVHRGEYVFTKGETRSFTSLLKQIALHLVSIKANTKDTASSLIHTVKSTAHGIKNEWQTPFSMPMPLALLFNSLKRGIVAPQVAISKMFTGMQRKLFSGHIGGDEKRAFFEKHGLLISDEQKKKQLLDAVPLKLGEIVKYQNSQLEVLENIYDVLQLNYRYTTNSNHKYRERDAAASEYNNETGMYVTPDQMDKIAHIRGLKAKRAMKQDQFKLDNRFFGLSGLARSWFGRSTRKSINAKTGMRLSTSHDMADLYEDYARNPSLFESKLRYEEARKEDIESNADRYRGSLWHLGRRKKIVSTVSGDTPDYRLGQVDPNTLTNDFSKRTIFGKLKSKFVKGFNIFGRKKTTGQTDDVSNRLNEIEIDKSKHKEDTALEYLKKIKDTGICTCETLNLSTRRLDDIKSGLKQLGKGDDKSGGLFSNLFGLTGLFGGLAKVVSPLVSLLGTLPTPLLALGGAAAFAVGLVNEQKDRVDKNRNDDNAAKRFNKDKTDLTSDEKYADAFATNIEGGDERLKTAGLSNIFIKMKQQIVKRAFNKDGTPKSFTEMSLGTLDLFNSLNDLNELGWASVGGDNIAKFLNSVGKPPTKIAPNTSGDVNGYTEMGDSAPRYAIGGNPYLDISKRNRYSNLDASMFSNSGSYRNHSGYVLGNSNIDSVNAIIHKGEYVLTKGETQSITGLLGKITIILGSLYSCLKDLPKIIEPAEYDKSKTINSQSEDYISSRLKEHREKYQESIAESTEPSHTNKSNVIPIPVQMPSQSHVQQPVQKIADPIAAMMIDRIFTNTILNFSEATTRFAFGQTPFSPFK